MSDQDWVGVEFDGTLAMSVPYTEVYKLGMPIYEMVRRVKAWLEEGVDVRIVTARVSGRPSPAATAVLTDWLLLNIGRVLPLTCIIDDGMTELWSSRAVQVRKNTGFTESPHQHWRDRKLFEQRKAKQRKMLTAKFVG